MQIPITVEQLQRLVNQAFKGLAQYARDPKAKPQLLHDSDSLYAEMRRAEELIRFYQGGFIFGQWDPKAAYGCLSHYLDLWTSDYIGFWEEPQYYDDSEYQILYFLADFMPEIKRLGFELAFPDHK